MKISSRFYSSAPRTRYPADVEVKLAPVGGSVHHTTPPLRVVTLTFFTDMEPHHKMRVSMTDIEAEELAKRLLRQVAWTREDLTK